MSKLVFPKENLFRAVYALPPTVGEADDEPVRALRADEVEEGDGRTLELQWAVFDRWTEIDSWFEGRFMERIAPGAFKKTIRENRQNMRILLQHGRDPQLGSKPIASLDVLEENDIGGYAEGRLFDGLDQLVVDGLRAGQYGASFRFRVMREKIDQEPGESEHNPHGLPERSILEASVNEFGPVTWGAYSEATAGVRSITDEMHFGALRDMPRERLAEVAEFWRAVERREDTTTSDAPSPDESGERREQHPTDAPASTATRRTAPRYLGQRPTAPAWRL